MCWYSCTVYNFKNFINAINKLFQQIEDVGHTVFHSIPVGHWLWETGDLREVGQTRRGKMCLLSLVKIKTTKRCYRQKWKSIKRQPSKWRIKCVHYEIPRRRLQWIWVVLNVDSDLMGLFWHEATSVSNMLKAVLRLARRFSIKCNKACTLQIVRNYVLHTVQPWGIPYIMTAWEKPEVLEEYWTRAAVNSLQ